MNTHGWASWPLPNQTKPAGTMSVHMLEHVAGEVAHLCPCLLPWGPVAQLDTGYGTLYSFFLFNVHAPVIIVFIIKINNPNSITHIIKESDLLPVENNRLMTLSVCGLIF